MNIQIGDYVKVGFGDLHNAHPIDDAMMIGLHEEWGFKYFKGKVVDIKTHTWFGLIKLKNPTYVVHFPTVHRSFYVKKLKPIIRIPVQ